MNRAMVALTALALATGCGGHSKSNKGSSTAAGATSAAATSAATGVQGAPSAGSVNVLAAAPVVPTGSASSSPSPTPSSSTSTGGGTATTGAGATPTPTGGGGAAGSSSAPFGGSTFAAAPTSTAVIHGTIPPAPTTGFDGTLYFVGERLVPGSIMHLAVNGVPTKVLPAVFHSSEMLGVYVYLTVPADYTFTAVAPDGTTSTPVTFTVANGGFATLTGMNPPEVHMVFPPALDTSFMGTVWLIGDQMMPGCVLTVDTPGLPPYVATLLWINERTAGWITASPLAGDVTLRVTNPTLMSSQTFTVTVGPVPQSAGGATPTFSSPGGVSSPFLGTVQLIGSGLQPGATVELREVSGPTLSTTPLIAISTSEAWWTLVYPQQGLYEIRVVNPGGAASAWQVFDVR